MKIGIIGAGFTGLAAAYALSKNGENVYVFEGQGKPGGLAAGFRARQWEWSLEKHYHHWFTSDWEIRKLAKEINHEVMFLRPKTSVLVEDKIYQLDSAVSLLTFPHLPLPDRLRTGFTLFYLRTTPFWKPLENKTSANYLKKSMGENSWKLLWQPLFEGKFGKYSHDIPASWFWSRIKKRSALLGYPIMGFEGFAGTLVEKIEDSGGKIIYNTTVTEVEKKGNKFKLKVVNGNIFEFDKVINTLPTHIFVKTTKNLPVEYVNKIKPLKGLGAVTLIISSKNKLFEDGTYWLNVNDRSYPFLAVVEHTNLVDKKYYANENIIYIGNYLEPGHEYFSLSAEQLLKRFTKDIMRINKNFGVSMVNDVYVFKSDFAQPIVPLNYSKFVPDFKTPIEGLYLANIQQVYPWDRGTNYAVEIGNKVADMVIKSQ